MLIIIPRQALASKDLSAEFDRVMTAVVSIINFIKADDVNACVFRMLCIYNNANRTNLLFYYSVWWLSRGKFLAECLNRNVENFKDLHFND